jgi:predicted acylesterase/phospholipase RssA
MHTPIRRIALGGGGAKGILHIGVLQEIARNQPLDFPDGIYGSSVGSIIASCVAFKIPLDGILEFSKTYSSIESLIPPNFEIQQISKMFSGKGVYTMDVFEEKITQLFESNGVAIRNKTLADANMPLFIIASNITTGKPTVFSGSIPVLDALKCSCSVPVFFRPQHLYGNVYIDGDIFSPCIASLVPEGTICISLNKHGKCTITPSKLDTISPFEYISSVYALSFRVFQKSQRSSTTFELYYPNLYSDTDLSSVNVDEILVHAADKFRRFLRTQVLN